jgi:hypothetical protein
MLCELTADDNKIIFCSRMQKTLTMLSLTAGSVSSILCNTSLGIPVARECRHFHNLETYFYHTLQKLIHLQEFY